MSENIVIIGAVALGPKAACRLKRLKPEANVVMVDQADLISYGGCGIPYFVSGDVSDISQLQSTSFHMVRDKKFFQDAKGIEVMTNTRVVSIDRAGKEVLVRNVMDGKEQILPYDKLVLATGSRPRRLPIPGAELPGVFTVSNLDEAEAIKKEIAAGRVNKAAVIGAGAIGLEMAEALADLWGIETSVIEVAEQVMPGVVSPEIARMARHHLEENGLSIHLSEEVVRIEGSERVERVVTKGGVLDADLVIMSVGIVPNSELAGKAGLELSSWGGIKVNEKLLTSDPDIYAGGDCVEIQHLLTGKGGYFPSGSLANREGRVIGSNLAGGNAVFEGAVGTFAIKLFELSIASAGLSMEKAIAEGLDPFSVFVVQFDRSHFYPEKDLVYLELIAEKGTGKVLGVQGLGGLNSGMFARVSAVAAILKYQPVAADISNLEFPYAPPFSAAMDVVNVLGNTAENILAGKNRVIDTDQFADWWENRATGDTLFLDCRGWGNAEYYVNKYPEVWKSIPQDELRRRIEEVPEDKRLVLMCNTGARSYEAQITLDEMGFHDTFNLQGGVAALKKRGYDL